MAPTLRDALGEIDDDRGRKGRQYQLRSVINIALAAMLAGANELWAIYRWGQRRRPEALPLFEITNGKASCHAAYHNFFQSLDAGALSCVLGTNAMTSAKTSHISIDGKTLRGQPHVVLTRNCNGTNPHDPAIRNNRGDLLNQ